ncbi:MAG: Crp/Fnr family transcriptional regulator [Salinivirgaceae bacterium]|jgi:CRP-like cAMP-binding protein|nr:Crp/Fnr family transcriptional regulator [Salinivirgaceae bacterium]
MDIKSCKSCRECPVRWRNFDKLTDEEIKRASENRKEAHYKRGEIIFKQGSPTTSAVFLKTGLVKMAFESEYGKEVIVAIVKPGRIIAGPGAFIDDIHHFSVTALKDTAACFMDLNIIKDFVRNNGEFALGFLQDISIKSVQEHHKIVSITQKRMNGRLAEGLLHLSENIFVSPEFDCCLTRQELGELTYMTKESVVRLLKQFHDEGIIEVEGSKFRILDKDRLEKIKQSG